MKKQDDIYLREMEARIQKIASHLKKTSQIKFMKSDLHRSAIVRELEVMGEAANRVSAETKAMFPSIPWQQMIGMRNRLIHGYFDVDYFIVWEVAKNEIPKLLEVVRQAILETAPALHRWQVCPAGYYHVRRHARNVKASSKHESGKTSVRQHCRRNPSGKSQLYPDEILEIMERGAAELQGLGTIARLSTPTEANNFDMEILVWTKYWNDIFNPVNPLDPNVVKALLGSESTFGKFSKDVRVSAGNYARGPFQITDKTRKYLSDEKGELSDHYLTLTAKDVKNSSMAASAAIRWLFHKKYLASSYLGHEATWDEAVAEYKAYLRKKKPFQEQKGMKNYFEILGSLRKSSS